MRKKLVLGDCLEVLSTLPENKIDTCITDPPYFLINDNGSGFMGKEWDGIINLWKYLWSDKQFVSFVGRFLNALQVEENMEGGNIVLESVNTILEEKKTSNNACIVGKISDIQTKSGNSVQQIAITKDALLDLLSELSPSLTKEIRKYLLGERENVLFVIPILLHHLELKNTVRQTVTELRKVEDLEERKITFTKTEIVKRKNSIEGIIGTLSENESTKEINGDADIAENIVVIKKSNVTTLNHTERIKIIRNLTLLLCAYLAMRLWSKMSSILIETFFKVTFQEVFRTLKPGGLVLAFGGTRTWHQLAKSLENAGFEIRDTICWLHGQGFPKSYNISKGIDKKAGKERETIKEIKKTQSFGQYAAGKNQVYGGWKEEKQENMKITAPATLEAEIWEGYGTALKPAFEPIIIAMKPIDGTFVNNALTHGVAGMWIDGGRIPTNPEVDDPRLGGKGSWKTDKAAQNVYEGGYAGIDIASSPDGRWPANTILSHHPDCKQTDETITVEGYTINRWKDNAHPFGGGAGNEYESEHKEDEEIAVWECVDDCPVRLLNEQSGNTPSNKRKSKGQGDGAGMFGVSGGNTTGHNDSGGASRFFYCAKASKKERNAGLDDLEDKPAFNYGSIKKSPGRTGINTPRKNTHATVKPLALMEYLCKLTRTPTGGIVLDPFMGSGTTGMACVNTGRDFIGIELVEEHFEIAKRRIEYAQEVLSAD